MPKMKLIYKKQAIKINYTFFKGRKNLGSKQPDIHNVQHLTKNKIRYIKKQKNVQ